MSKEIVGVVLDGGALLKSSTQHLQAAITRVHKVLHRGAIEDRASDMCGLVLVGTAETKNPMDFANIALWGPFKRSVDRLAQWQGDLEGVQWHDAGDLLDGVVQCGAGMVEAVGGGKFGAAVMFVFSTGDRIAGMQLKDAEGCREVRDRLDGEGVEVLFVHCDCVDGVPFGECLSSEHFDREFTNPTKRVRPTTLYRGHLTIGDLRVSVKCLNKTQVAPLPRGKWIGGGGVGGVSGVSGVSGHYDKQTGELVQPERMLKAYKYGTDRIPFSLLDLDQASGGSGLKGLWVIGFGHCSQLCRAAYLSTVMAIVPDREDDGDSLLVALTSAMEQQERVGLARFKRTDKADVKLLYLVPSTSKQCLYAVTAPFAEDHRRWSFPRLPVPAGGAVDVMAGLIGAMSPHQPDITSLNPTLHHIWQVIRQRAIYGENADIAAVSVDLIAPLAAPIARDTAGTVRDLMAHLPITVNAASDSAWHRTTSADALTRFWSTRDKAGDVGGDVGGGLTDPLSLFNKLVNDATEDRVGEAMLMLMTAIPRILYRAGPTDADTVEMATRCLRRLRTCATQHSLSLRYNAFVSELKRRALRGDDAVARRFFVEAVARQGLGLIGVGEDEESGVTPAEAADFMVVA